jgi:hypothetical protein
MVDANQWRKIASQMGQAKDKGEEETKEISTHGGIALPRGHFVKERLISIFGSILLPVHSEVE